MRPLRGQHRLPRQPMWRRHCARLLKKSKPPWSDFTRSVFWFQSQANPSRIRMAPPFSGVETSFRVKVQDNVYYANCAWDALGIAAALQADAKIEASDGYSGEPIMLEVRNGQPVPQSCVIHFAVPAAHWWDDILYT